MPCERKNRYSTETMHWARALGIREIYVKSVLSIKSANNYNRGKCIPLGWATDLNNSFRN